MTRVAKNVFFGPRGLRAGWRIAIFFGIAVPLRTLLRWVIDLGFSPSHTGPWTWRMFIAGETPAAFGLISASVALAAIEHRPMRDYALPPLTKLLSWRFWEGIVWATGAVSVLYLTLSVAGCFTISGFNLPPSQLATAAMGWAAAFFLVGVAEELFFRGTPQMALAEALHFWPAAVITSLAFAAAHYFSKPDETIADFVALTMTSLFLCLTLIRTGDLRFAIGYHAMLDYGGLTVFGAPNSGNGGQPLADRLLATNIHGPSWLTGGVLGVQASWLAPIITAALFLLFVVTHKGRHKNGESDA